MLILSKQIMYCPGCHHCRIVSLNLWEIRVPRERKGKTRSVRVTFQAGTNEAQLKREQLLFPRVVAYTHKQPSLVTSILTRWKGAKMAKISNPCCDRAQSTVNLAFPFSLEIKNKNSSIGMMILRSSLTQLTFALWNGSRKTKKVTFERDSPGVFSRLLLLTVQ